MLWSQHCEFESYSLYLNNKSRKQTTFKSSFWTKSEAICGQKLEARFAEIYKKCYEQKSSASSVQTHIYKVCFSTNHPQGSKPFLSDFLMLLFYHLFIRWRTTFLLFTVNNKTFFAWPSNSGIRNLFRYFLFFLSSLLSFFLSSDKWKEWKRHVFFRYLQIEEVKEERGGGY